MTRRSWFVLLPILFCLGLCCEQLHAATINANSCSASDVQTAINASSTGDTVVLPSGNCTWTTQVTIASKGITLQGQTTCTPNAPGSTVTSCSDNTNITLGVAGANSLSASGLSNTTLLDLSGITFITNSTYSNGEIQLNGTQGTQAFHVHNIHLIGAASNAVAFNVLRIYGLFDHWLFDDTAPSAPPSVPINVLGDYPSAGYLNWAQATNFGSSEAVYIEDSAFNFSHIGSEGVIDCYEGAKFVLRYSTVVGNTVGGCHGTDSGPFRSSIVNEVYNMTISANQSGNVEIFNTRGGTVLWHDNVTTFTGGGAWQAIALQYYRMTSVNDVGKWGTIGAGLNWTPTSMNGSANTLNAPDWLAGHPYSGCPSACAVVAPSSNNPGGYNYQVGGNCTSGGSAPAFSQTFGGTTSDGNCTWTMVGGSKSAGSAKWCAANPDTQCTADATCSALSNGDTCSRFFDANGGAYPYRDQPGRVHNQVLAPNYAWNNSGAGTPNPIFQTVGDSSIVQVNRDYYNNTAMPGYTPYTYPHPLQSGDLPPAPPTQLNAIVH